MLNQLVDACEMTALSGMRIATRGAIWDRIALALDQGTQLGALLGSLDNHEAET